MAEGSLNTDPLVSQASSWSLASDSRLLEALQELSTQLSNQTKQVQQQLDQLAVTTNKTATRLANTTNNFMLLSNTQFIEARVYEDADLETEGVDVTEAEVAKTNEELLEQSNQLICGALKLGINVIETAFEKVEIDDSDSDEDETQPSEVILQPKNPYHVRPLPYVIGTQAFHDDDHVGLIDEEDLSLVTDDESDESDTESEHPDDDDDKVSEYSESDEESPAKISVPPEKPIKAEHFLSEDSESEFSDDDLFSTSTAKEKVTEKPPSIDVNVMSSGGENTDDENDGESVPKMPAGPMSFTSELSAKLGLGPTLASKGSSKPKVTNDDSLDEDNESHSSNTGDGVVKSKKSVMFDNSSDSEDDLFKPETPKSKKSTVAAKNDPIVDQPHEPKIPTGGVSMFGPAKPSSNVEVKQETKPTKPKLDSLFDDLSDDDDLFADIKVVAASAKKKMPVSTSKKVKEEDIFDDDIFSDKETVTSKKKENDEKEGDLFDEDIFSEKKPAKTSKKSLSIFGDLDDDDDDLFADLVIKKKPSNSSKVSKSKELIPEEVMNTSSKDDNTTEDLEATEKGETNDEETKEASKIKKPIGGVSIFGGFNPKSLLKKSPEKEVKELKGESSDKVNISETSEIDGKLSSEVENDTFDSEKKLAPNFKHDDLKREEELSRSSAPAVLVSDKAPETKKVTTTPVLVNDKVSESKKIIDSPQEIAKDVVDKGPAHPANDVLDKDAPALLVSAGKSRPKVKSNRRPPSRGARHAAAKAAETAANDPIEDGGDDIEEKVSVPKSAVSPKQPSPFGGVNLFGGVSPTDVLKKRSPTPNSKIEDQTDSKAKLPEVSSSDISKTPETLPSNSPPASSFTPPPLSSNSPPASSFTPPPLSSFSPPPMTEDETTSPGSLFGSSFEDHDVLFPPTTSKVETSNNMDDLFGDSDDDDLFGISSSSSKIEKKEVKSNSDDLFGGSTVKKAAPSLFDDDSEDDDLFASLTSSKKK